MNGSMKPMEIFQAMQQLETKEEMIAFLRQLPRAPIEDEDTEYDDSGGTNAPPPRSRGVSILY